MSSIALVEQTTAPLPLFAILSELLSDAVSTLDEDRDGTRNTLSRAVALLDAEQASPIMADNHGGLAPWQARVALREIEANLETSISIADLARSVRLGRSRFSRAFKTTFGASPQKYIVERRVGRAQKIMLTSDESLCQVAISCGFSDQSHFSRVFRQVTGDSPFAWRRARYGGRWDERAMMASVA